MNTPIATVQVPQIEAFLAEHVTPAAAAEAPRLWEEAKQALSDWTNAPRDAFAVLFVDGGATAPLAMLTHSIDLPAARRGRGRGGRAADLPVVFLSIHASSSEVSFWQSAPVEIVVRLLAPLPRILFQRRAVIRNTRRRQGGSSYNEGM